MGTEILLFSANRLQVTYFF